MLYGELDEAMTLLTPELIPSHSIDSLTPNDYLYRVATDADRFFLDEYSIDGGVVRYGPFSLGHVYGSHASPAAATLQAVQFLPMIWER